MPTSWFREEKMHRNFIRDVYAMTPKTESGVTQLITMGNLFVKYGLRRYNVDYSARPMVWSALGKHVRAMNSP